MPDEPTASPRTLSARPLILVVLGMLMLTYASVPLYRVFCKVTGFGGTPQKSESATQFTPTDRSITVRFNTDIAPSLPWSFTPPKPVQVRIGVPTLVSFEAENLSDHPITGVATFNVTPFALGPYFSKIQCFCFESQTLTPGQKVRMPVSFTVDPAMLSDPEARTQQEVTLSYTFFEKK